MCVAAIAWDAHPDWLLVVAGNRDEFHARAAAPLARWTDGSGIIAGTDLVGGGTWLGVTEAGRFALVTNYRVPEGSRPGRPSRGKLVTGLLTGTLTAPLPDACQGIERMNPFNLILADDGRARFVTNHPSVEIRTLDPGLHGLSNGGFDVPWAKTRKVATTVDRWMAASSHDPAPLFEALADRTPAPAGTDHESGPEPRFSPVFIRDEIYGTRCSTVIAVDRAGRGIIMERSFDATGTATDEVRIEFTWPTTAVRAV